jgi:serine/threonine protein phosphatase PrpC
VIEWTLANEPCGAESQDRAAMVQVGQAQVAVIADGAGGSAGGREASDSVPRILGSLQPSFREVQDPEFWVQALTQCDAAIEADGSAGETTGVAVVAVGGVLVGASVGDSGAYIFTNSQFIELTAHQVRKPLLGSGRARPTGFGPLPFEGTLLVASDGLLKYASVQQVWGLLSPMSLPDIVASLIAQVRLPSGDLQDDVSVVLARPR